MTEHTELDPAGIAAQGRARPDRRRHRRPAPWRSSRRHVRRARRRRLDRHAPDPGVADDPVRHVRISLDSTPLPAKTARDGVVSHCGPSVPIAVVHDLQLVVSELVTNVIEHGGGSDELVVDLLIGEHVVELQVTGRGDRRLLPAAGRWDFPPVAQRTGRGLALVRRLSGSVRVDGGSGPGGQHPWLSIRATVPFAAA